MRVAPLRLVCIFCITFILAGCGSSQPGNRWLFYLTAPTNIRFSPDAASASYDGIIRNLSNGEQKKVGQVRGYGCLKWSDENQLFLRVVEDQIHQYDQNLRQVASLSVKDMFINTAAWMPDGKRIVFSGETRDAPYGRVNLFVIDKDGANIQKLAFVEDKNSRSYSPAVSPDGKQMVFDSNRDYDKKPGDIFDFDIYLTWFNESEVVRLTDGGSDERNPAWSPDGKYLAFTSNTPDTVHDSLVYNIFLINLENQSITQLTHNSNSFFRSPLWAPDGKEIAYTHQRRDLMQPQDVTIATISIDGKTIKEIPCQEGFSCFCPQWIP